MGAKGALLLVGVVLFFFFVQMGMLGVVIGAGVVVLGFYLPDLLLVNAG